MSVAAAALQPQMVHGLIAMSGRAKHCHLPDVITDSRPAGYNIDYDLNPESIRIDFRETAYVAERLAGEACRFASASFTSYSKLGVSFAEADDVAWNFIKLYYSAFYAGHSILRIGGVSCSYIYPEHVRRLKQLSNATGQAIPFKISAGLYKFALNASQSGFELTHAAGRVGGAHEAFWEVFDSFLNQKIDLVLMGHLPPEDAQSVFAKIEALRRILHRGSGASWLSAVRNDIQYRHGWGIWAPLQINKRGREVLGRVAGQQHRDPMDIDLELPPGGELGLFVSACAFIVALCVSLFTRLKDIAQDGSRSFALMPLRQCAAAMA